MSSAQTPLHGSSEHDRTGHIGGGGSGRDRPDMFPFSAEKHEHEEPAEHETTAEHIYIGYVPSDNMCPFQLKNRIF